MEILSYVLSGELSHTDNQGNAGIIRNGDIQRMTAGTGIMHSEFNASKTDPVHFLQIWIVPGKRGVPPRYEDRGFPIAKRQNRLCLVASPDEAEGSLSIDQDVRVYAATLDAGKEVSLDIGQGRAVWVQAAKGTISVGHGFTAAPPPKKGATAPEASGTSEGSAGVAGAGLECAGAWTELEAGDGAALQGERKIAVRAESGAEVLVFDLA